MNEVLLPEIRIGESMKCGALAVYPLFAGRTLLPEQTLDYQLSSEAQEAGTCVVREVSPEPTVGELLIENTGTVPVLFVEGEELSGGKQCRVMRTTVLVPARSRIVVPVYCVERGRWDGSPTSLKTGSHSPPTLRHLLKGSNGSPGISHRGNGQVAVWRYIAAKHSSTGTCSPKGNMSDALQSRPEVVKSLRSELRYPEGASGIAVVMRGRTIGIDLFDKPKTLRQVWDRLVVLGLTLDAIDMRPEDAGDMDLPVRLYRVRSVRWKQVETVGLGEAFVARDDDDSLATALVVDGVPVHMSVSMPTIG